MVFGYEKYCDSCECDFKQDSTFWKTYDYKKDIFEEQNRITELKKDKKIEKT